MTTIAKCTNCDSAFKVKDHLVGKAVRCPRCGEAFRVETSGRATKSTAKTTSVAEKNLAERKKQEPSVDPLLVEPSTELASSEGFFDTHEDVDAIYAATVVSAKQKKRQRQLIFMIASSSVAAILLIVGTVVAFQYVYDNADIPLELNIPVNIDVSKLEGNWRPSSDPQWGYTVRMPGEPEISTDDDKVRTLKLRDPQFGTMTLELRKEAHPEWNEFLAKVDRDEVFQGVPAANVMKISSEVTYHTDSVAVHRYILVSKDSRLTKNVAVVHKFSVEGTTITAMWSGKRDRIRSPEVLYFFSSLEILGDKYITH
ncbi:MJ0042-type zinc finger domain-containing protein [Bremerella sp. P1]|uniref:MJ0042-type zinc finger domain-containing protein n=1 Tax=Bremerella sp. P1 TaxID=3026424 RepID=UPI002367FCD2|nr:MJ0042-type zinc finger domain-containing protein [Bremerella sp. P1]WDI41910.1 hypothetical protein PSR63_26000 [Bremerella sp. P1]